MIITSKSASEIYATQVKKPIDVQDLDSLVECLELQIELNPRDVADAVFVGEFSLCDLLVALQRRGAVEELESHFKGVERAPLAAFVRKLAAVIEREHAR